MLAASPQLDFYDYDHPTGWQQGIYMPPVPDWILPENERLRSLAKAIVLATETGQTHDPKALDQVNAGCRQLNQWLFTQTSEALAAGKKVGIVGGDHSVPLGALQAIAQKYGPKHEHFGILHIDAHCDLREAYQGFEFSHASIMHNALKLPQLAKLVQVGIRDVSPREMAFATDHEKVVVHHDTALKRSRYAGTPWLDLCHQIVADLPQKVYISFDIDGLDPKLCPATGTPVPGGLDLDEAFCLLKVVADTREIIGFDLCEVGPDEWDGNVAARIVYKLCNLMGLARGED